MNKLIRAAVTHACCHPIALLYLNYPPWHVLCFMCVCDSNLKADAPP